MTIAKKTLFGSLIVATFAVLIAAVTVAVSSFNIADEHLTDRSKNQLIAIRDLQTSTISGYLESIRKQIITYSNNDMVIEASKGFKDAFYDMGTDRNGKSVPSVRTMKSELKSYYRDEYGARYRERNSNSNLRPTSLLDGVSDIGVLSQYYFIQVNPNPLGSKDALDRPELDNTYADLHEKYHPFIRQYLQQFEYYDIFIIDPDTGHIIYSVFKELDYGTSLLSGPYADSGLARVFKAANRLTDRDDVSFDPFVSYTPSYEDPASFVASPIFDTNGQKVAILAFQMPIDRINAIMTFDQKWAERGMGLSGETYLVSEDKKIQNLSRFLIDDKENYLAALEEAGMSSSDLQKIATKDTSIGIQEVDTIGVSEALDGKTGFDIFPDYRGVNVLSAYTYIDFLGQRFALMSEIDEDEAFAHVDEIISSVLIQVIVETIIILSIVGVIAWWASKILSQKLSAAVRVAESVAEGKTAHIEGADSGDELGALMHALDRMQTELIAGFEERAQSTARITRALDVSNTNLMLVNNDLEIIYANDSMEHTFSELSVKLSSSLHQLKSGGLAGQCLRVTMVDDPESLFGISQLHTTSSKRIEIGELTFDVVANPVSDDNGKRLGTVVEWLDMTDILAKQESERAIADENVRIRESLDNVNSSVMLADNSNEVIYVNQSLIELLSTAQTDIQSVIPGFTAAGVLHADFDLFNKCPTANIEKLNSVVSPKTKELVLGSRHFVLTISPVKNADNIRIGTAVEWQDKTAEVRTENEVSELILSASQGDLSDRINLSNKSGFFKNLGEGLNKLLDINANFIDEMSTLFGAMAQGDLTKSINSEYQGQFDQIKQNANLTLSKLNEVMETISNNAQSVISSANEVSRGAGDLSGRTESQASALQQTASSMEEINATVQQSTKYSAESSELASEAKDNAQAGGEVVQQAITSMGEILEASRKINDIITVIDEIAFQTNLLALNAAVEAARAGEQGRGFAVVAGEVRNLSQRSAGAAKEIKDLIRDSVNKVETGSELVNQSGDTLAKIVSSVEVVAERIEQVNVAAKEQSSGIAQINGAISNMDSMTQQNAALVEQTSSAAREMANLAGGMNQALSFFSMTKGSGRAVPSPVPSAPAPAANFTASPAPAAPSSAPAPRMDEPKSNNIVSPYSASSSTVEDDDWEDF